MLKIMQCCLVSRASATFASDLISVQFREAWGACAGGSDKVHVFFFTYRSEKYKTKFRSRPPGEAPYTEKSATHAGQSKLLEQVTKYIAGA